MHNYYQVATIILVRIYSLIESRLYRVCTAKANRGDELIIRVYRSWCGYTHCYFRFRELFLSKIPKIKNYTRVIIASWQRTISNNTYKWRGIDKLSWNADESSYIRKISPFQSIRYFYRGNIFNEMVTMHSIKKYRKCIGHYGKEVEINNIREAHSFQTSSSVQRRRYIRWI